MPFSVLADLVVVAHFLFVLFVVLGGFLVLHKQGWAWLHLPATIWGVLIEFMGWICPLTPLENRLRFLGGGVGYSTDFIERYITSLIYPSVLTRSHQIILGVFVIVVNVSIYVWIIWQRNRNKIRY